MKKLAILAIAVLVLTMVLAPAAYAAKPVPQLLDRVDIGDEIDEVGHEVNVSEPDWGPVEPTTHGGNWGGIISPDTCRVVSYSGDPTPGYATLTLDTHGDSFARHIVLWVLDGIADDSFNVYVKNPGDEWVLVYSYTCDPSTSEYWVDHHIYSFPAGKGQGGIIEMKIEATGGTWSGFDTYGQLAVDWVEVWDH